MSRLRDVRCSPRSVPVPQVRGLRYQADHPVLFTILLRASRIST